MGRPWTAPFRCARSRREPTILTRVPPVATQVVDRRPAWLPRGWNPTLNCRGIDRIRGGPQQLRRGQPPAPGHLGFVSALTTASGPPTEGRLRRLGDR